MAAGLWEGWSWDVQERHGSRPPTGACASAQPVGPCLSRFPFAEYAGGEGPLWGVGPFGECLDLTPSRRHGGVFGVDTDPAGGAVVFPGQRLAGIDCFTVVLWARQNPALDGVNPRLAMTETGWDLLPAPRGIVLSFLAGDEKKTTANLSVVPSERGRVPGVADWRFTAVAVDREVVRGYLGGLSGEPVAATSCRARGSGRGAPQASTRKVITGARPESLSAAASR
jgi:hypothetical protein